jgi:hypothetical protein
MNMRARIVLVLTVLLTLSMSSPALALDVCGQPFLIIDGATDPVVDIDCETGYTVVANATVNLLAGAHISEVYGGAGGGILTSGGYNTINIYAGQIDTMLNFGSTDTVTVYGSDFAVNGVLLDPAQTQVVNTGAGTLVFDLTGFYQDGSNLSLPCYLEAGAILNLNIPQTTPEIDVLPAMLAWDLGDVEVGQSATMLVQIFNSGTADLNVSSVTLTGDAGFVITAGPTTPLVIAPNTSIGVDFEVTFTPSVQGPAMAVVQIVSDDQDEPVVEVVLNGVGIITDVPPLQQIQNILDFFDASVAQGTLQGYGPGNSAANRLKALRNMIEAASDLIGAEAYDQAVVQLASVADKTDGAAKPQDFVVGEATAELNAMVEALIFELTF